MRGTNPRQTKRMMQRLGMKVDEIPNAKQVIIRTENKDILIDNPDVAVIEVQGQRVFQIVGGRVSEKSVTKDVIEEEIPNEDVQLVVNQTGKSLSEVKAALKETNGDLAKAILLLQSKS
ncbi:nascent polypeptide-associated complex protein [Candidatus Bathyarchaeota archaeon]|nr:nascent polypeptide-associated complex protein [Candidatus Bathyarchaeota archaeon]